MADVCGCLTFFYRYCLRRPRVRRVQVADGQIKNYFVITAATTAAEVAAIPENTSVIISGNPNPAVVDCLPRHVRDVCLENITDPLVVIALQSTAVVEVGIWQGVTGLVTAALPNTVEIVDIWAGAEPAAIAGLSASKKMLAICSGAPPAAVAAIPRHPGQAPQHLIIRSGATAPAVTAISQWTENVHLMAGVSSAAAAALSPHLIVTIWPGVTEEVVRALPKVRGVIFGPNLEQRIRAAIPKY